LITGQVVTMNPASALRGPKNVVKRTGKTPVLDGTEWHKLVDAIPTRMVRDLRDRALIATLTYSFARIIATLKMKVEVEDLRPQGTTASAVDGPDLLPPKAFASAREVLASTPWLQAVPSDTLDALAEQAVLHRVPSGSILFEQAEIPSFAQVLLAGCVDLVAVNGESASLVEAVQPIDLLLPAAVLNRQPYLARVSD
jgi:hypothetical protein